MLLQITWTANMMQQGNFINVFLARHVSGTYAHHQEHWMLSCSYLLFYYTYDRLNMFRALLCP